jgi:hypothetical protein
MVQLTTEQRTFVIKTFYETNRLQQARVAFGLTLLLGILFDRTKGPFSTQENSLQKEKFVKCDWPTQMFRRKKF